MTTAAKFFAGLSIGLVTAWYLGVPIPSYLMACLCSVLVALPPVLLGVLLLELRQRENKASEAMIASMGYASMLFVYPRWGMDLHQIFVLVVVSACSSLALGLIWPEKK